MKIKAIVRKIVVYIRYVFILYHHIQCYTSALLWLFLMWPLRRTYPSLFWRLYHLVGEMLVTMGTWYSWSAGYGIVELGDDISNCLNDKSIMLLNHQSAGDIVVLWNIVLARQELVEGSMWIMNEEFQYTPFGLFCHIRKDFFIPIGREVREYGLARFKDHLKRWYVSCSEPLFPRKKTIVLFPEGGFLYKRREKSNKYALQHNLPTMQNVCLPRLGAVNAILDVCPPCKSMTGAAESELRWVLDVTIAYPGGKPLGLHDITAATRKPFNTMVLYRLYPATQLSRDPEQVAAWLYARWQEKEEILTKYYATGEINFVDVCSNPIAPRVLLQNPVQHTCKHIFFFVSFWGFLRIILLFVSIQILIILLVLYSVFITLKIMKKI